VLAVGIARGQPKWGDEISRPSAGTQNTAAWLAVADENAVDVEIKMHSPNIA
jgi:hypothetical protein